MIRIAICTDIRLYRDGLAAALNSFSQLEVVATAGEVGQLLDAVDTNAPDVVLMDASMAGSLAAIRTLGKRTPEIPVLSMGIVECERDVLASIEHGAAGYVTRDAAIDELVTSIESVVNGEAHCSPQIVATLLRRLAALASDSPNRAVERLTTREREIVRLIDRGLSNKEIAFQLSISVSTVKNHVHSILEKMSLRRRSEVSAHLRNANYEPVADSESP